MTIKLSSSRRRVTEVDITPDRSIIPKLGKGGYTLAQALGELVDNSIEAAIPGQPLRVDLELTNNTITITDNGRGMTKDELAAALRLAYRPNTKKPGLGEFGIGLKASAMALGSRFSIVTRPVAGTAAYRAVFDEASWVEQGDWQHFPIETSSEIQKRGTHITIESPRLRSLKVRAPGVREEFGIRYSPLLTEGRLSIRVNGIPCRPFRWILHDDRKNAFEVGLASGKTVKGWWGLLEEGSLGRFGFNLYHRGRLIRRHERIGIIGVAPHPELAHLVGEIYMDPVPVTFNKREFIENSPEYEEVLSLIEGPLNEAIREAREFRLGQPADLPPALLGQLHSNLEALASLPEWPKLTSPVRILQVSSEPPGLLRAVLQVNKEVVRIRQRFTKGSQNDPLILDIRDNDGTTVLDLNSSHPLFSISKNRALLVSVALIEGVLISVLEPRLKDSVRAFLADRDRLLGEIVRAMH